MAPSIGVNLRVTGHSNQGGRKYMEDAFAVAYQQTEDEKDLEYAYFGIFDGHGGREAALFAKEHLMDYIVNQKNFWSDNDELVLKAIREGFISTHLAMWKEVATWPRTLSGLPSTAGTTASIIFIRKGKMYIGHVGDSAIVLGYKEPEACSLRVQPLTRDHKPESPSEKKRIEQTGGMVVNKSGVERVVWNRPRIGHTGPVRRSTHIDQIPFLAVARSLGDLWSYDYLHGGFVVSPEPDVSAVTLDPKQDRCIILGTDGLWNMLSPQEAAKIVQDAEEENEKYILEQGGNKPWVNPSKKLVDRALDLWAARKMRADNTTVVTVMLDPAGPPRSEVLLRQRILQKLRPREDFEVGYGDRCSPTALDVPESETHSRQLLGGKKSDYVTAVSSEKRVGSPPPIEKRIPNVKRSIGNPAPPPPPSSQVGTAPSVGISRRSLPCNSLPSLTPNIALVQQNNADKTGKTLRRSFGGMLPTPNSEKKTNEIRSMGSGLPFPSLQERSTVVEVRHSVGGGVPLREKVMIPTVQDKTKLQEAWKGPINQQPQTSRDEIREVMKCVDKTSVLARKDLLNEGTPILKTNYLTKRPELRRSLGTIISKLKPSMLQRLPSGSSALVPLPCKHPAEVVDEENSAGGSSDTENNGPPCPNSIPVSVLHKSVFNCTNSNKNAIPATSCNNPNKHNILGLESNKHDPQKPSCSSINKPTGRTVSSRRRTMFETPSVDLTSKEMGIDEAMQTDTVKDCRVDQCKKDGKQCSHDHKLRELSQKIITLEKKMEQKRQQCETKCKASSPSKRKMEQVEGPARKQPRLHLRGHTWTSGCGTPSIIRHITRSRLGLRRVHV